MKHPKHKLFKKKIKPIPLSKKNSYNIKEFINNIFFAYNAGRLKEACVLGETIVKNENITIGLTLAGAATPAGLGISTIIPLIESGYIDFVVSTGANLYHDLHFALDYSLYESHPFHDDIMLRDQGIIRIYDILFSEKVLFDTDAFVRQLLSANVFNKRMGTAEFHNLLGNAVNQIENKLNTQKSSVLAACYRNDIPIYTSSPGDSTFGLNLASMQLQEHTNCVIDSNIDVNETSSFVWNSVVNKGETAVVIVGGGSPKNFYLQTEPYLSEILGLPSRGHDYFIQFTDSRPDTGGLSGATPGEALSWGKIDPDKLRSSVVVYADSTIAFPLWAEYLLESGKVRENKKLYSQKDKLVSQMKKDSKNSSPPSKDNKLAEGIVF